MRTLFAALVLLLAVAAVPAHAQTQCALDAAAGGLVQCPFVDTNDGLRNAGFNGVRLDTANHLSNTPIFVHNQCRYIDARSTTAPLFVPFNSATEWNAFLNAATPGVHIAECCTPRAMRVADVPIPTETCSSGWVFQGLVNPDNADQLLATPNGSGGFDFANGVSENASYPIQKLPMERDDVGALLPQQATTAYVGKFFCAGTVDFSTSQSPVSTTATTSNNSWFRVFVNGREVRSTSTSTNGSTVLSGVGGTATNVTKLMGFAMQCRNNDWAYTSPSCFGRTTGIQVEACPSGQSGRITSAVIRQCDGTTTVQTISNTCGGICEPRTITEETRACPSGQTGSITVEKIRLCQGRQPVANNEVVNCQCTDVERIKTNTCTNSCPPSTDLGDQTQACPDGQTGRIVINTTRICTSQGDQCVCEDRQTVRENTCQQQCPPTTVTYENRQCPTGYTGYKRYRITRTCELSCQCGGAQCVCSNTEVLVENTCVNQCTPSTHTETQSCPAGYSGSITVTTTRVCPSGQTTTTTQNNCVPPPPPPPPVIIPIPIIIPWTWDTIGWDDIGGWDDCCYGWGDDLDWGWDDAGGDWDTGWF